MNIAQIKQVGIIDNWIDFNGQIIEIKETKSRTQKNRLMTKVKVQDETDIVGAWIYADVQQCTLNQIITANGMLKEYKDVKYIDYATVKNSQNAPQNITKTPQNAPQSMTSQQPAPQGKKEPDWDAIAEGKVRHGVVCAYIQSGSSLELSSIERWVNYILTGVDPDSAPEPHPDITNPDYVGDDPPPTGDSDIPF